MDNYLAQVFNLSDKVAVITGAGGHLCGEMARGLAKAGVAVAAMDLRLAKAEAVVKEIIEADGKAFSFELDVTKKEHFERSFEEVIKKFGHVDILINGAAINSSTPFFDITIEEWHNVLNFHLVGTLFGC